MFDTLLLLKEELDEIYLTLQSRAEELGKKQKDIFERSEKLSEAVRKLDSELYKEAIALIKSTQFGDELAIEKYFDSADFLDVLDKLDEFPFPQIEDAQKWRFEPYPWPDGSTYPLQTL